MNIALYIHIPYCIKKCPYCDFNSYGVGNKIPGNLYTNSLLNEIDLYRDTIKNCNINSIFFGGGTPSLFFADNIDKIINKINDLSFINKDIEVTIEVNPKTADLDKLKSYYRIGINRISLGVQSFSQRKLDFLGRLITPQDNIETINNINAAGIKNFNIDLMYGISNESLDEWNNDLKITIGFLPNHISAYCLTIESGTEFHKRLKNGNLSLPSDDYLSILIQHTSDYITSNGYKHYEISNYSLPGYESAHNTSYWRGQNYLGLGAGAHSHLKDHGTGKWGIRFSNIKNPSRYMNMVDKGLTAIDSYEELTRIQAFEDDLMMSIRLLDGFNIEYMQTKYNVEFNITEMEYLFSDNYLIKRSNHICLDKNGVLLSDYLISKLLDNTIFN
jgi:oxygen-independent coproporphyrinogen-3 oxidase